MIELKKEIEFINSFILLMQLRHSDEVKVTVVIPEQVPDTKIPPMLFISLLENAFKHGVNYPQKSYIYFELHMSSTFLTCIIKNSKHKIAANYQGEYSGIGLDNIKESLKLLYEDNFYLNILDKDDEFEVQSKNSFMKITCIAIDDEPLAVKKISAYIQKTPFLELVAECRSAFEAMEIINNRNIQLLFIDINMPDLNGLSL